MKTTEINSNKNNIYDIELSKENIVNILEKNGKISFRVIMPDTGIESTFTYKNRSQGLFYF